MTTEPCIFPGTSWGFWRSWRSNNCVTNPIKPHAKGKVEALNRTIKNEFQAEAFLSDFHTIEELNSAFWAWAEVVYNRRVHSATGEAPEERFLKGLLLKENEEEASFLNKGDWSDACWYASNKQAEGRLRSDLHSGRLARKCWEGIH